MSTGFACAPSDLHPYECDGAPACEHCARRIVICERCNGVGWRAPDGPEGCARCGGTGKWHDPATCALCEDSA